METLSIIHILNGFIAWTYLIGGFVIGVVNTLGFTVASVFYKQWRDKKNDILNTGLVYLGYEMLMGFSYMLNGISTLFIYNLKQTSSWACLVRPYAILFVINDTAAGVLPLLSAFNALFIVVNPLFDFPSFAKIAIFCPTVFSFGIVAASFVFTSVDENQNGVCMLVNSLPYPMFLLLKTVSLTFVLLALVVYAVFAIKYYNHFAHLTSKAENWCKPFKTVAIIFTTLLLFTIAPNVAMLCLQIEKPWVSSLIQFVYFFRGFTNMYTFTVTKNVVLRHILRNMPIVGKRFQPPMPVEWQCRKIENGGKVNVVELNVEKLTVTNAST